MVVALPAQLVLISMFNEGGDVTLGMPIYMSLILVFAVVLGGLVFDEFVALGANELSMIAVGVVLTITGVSVLSLRQQQKEIAMRHTSSTRKAPLEERPAESSVSHDVITKSPPPSPTPSPAPYRPSVSSAAPAAGGSRCALATCQHV